MNNVKSIQKCSNCGACYNSCPVNSITVNKEGMFYSINVDEDKCIDCGLCKKMCPVNNPNNVQTIQHAYAAINNDESILRNSSSGGMFRAVADYVINLGGVVYGAAYSEDFREVNIISSEDIAIEKLQKSKYVESQVGLTFRKVKETLKSGKTVLYCGAPCQIAGLKRFLKKEYDNLITCDFSCGGMPSHKIYQQWLDYLEHRFGSSICNVDFRPKTFGWYPYCVKIDFKNRYTYSRLSTEDVYFDCFIGSHMSVRDYCLECEFANNHYSDIILADFWKYKSISNVNNRNKGISLVITNSEKGDLIVNSVSNKVGLTVLSLEKAIYNLTDKTFSSEFINQRRNFLCECEEKGFIDSQGKKKYHFKLRIKYWIKRILKRA